MKKTYFLSYFYVDKKGQGGFGKSVIECGKKIHNNETISAVETYLKVEGNYKELTLLNFQRLKF